MMYVCVKDEKGGKSDYKGLAESEEPPRHFTCRYSMHMDLHKSNRPPTWSHP